MLAKGVAATQKALSKDEASKVGQIASRIDPTGSLDKIKTLISNPQVQKVLQKSSNEFIDCQFRAVLSNIIHYHHGEIRKRALPGYGKEINRLEKVGVRLKEGKCKFFQNQV